MGKDPTGHKEGKEAFPYERINAQDENDQQEQCDQDIDHRDLKKRMIAYYITVFSVFKRKLSLLDAEALFL